MTISRRKFLGSATAISLGFAGLRCAPQDASTPVLPGGTGFGPLLHDPEGIIALPEGFTYRIVSRFGERMDDGFYVPSRHDGMATFPGPGGTTLLVRNHEIVPGAGWEQGPFGRDNELLSRLPAACCYDPGRDAPALGGTTTLVYDTGTQTLVSHHLSLTGTLVNCAGGPTPWGSWLSCEEVTGLAGRRWTRDHGYVFEVPARTSGPPVEPVPLTAMGRFVHEAVAVQPGTSIVYETEDLFDGLLYRFLPDAPGELWRGGRLQALSVRGRPGLDTRNWTSTEVEPGVAMDVDWIDLDHPEAPDDDLRLRGHAAGAALFARGEGIWYGDDEVFVACTNGGRAQKGQIWRYVPSPAEGRPGEADRPGRIELFVEPNDGTIVENADNLTIAPWGDLVVCEDGTGDDYLVGVRPDGEIYKLAHNLNGNGEFAGACFSPDGSTFFVNMQEDGWTLAITGPWSGARI